MSINKLKITYYLRFLLSIIFLLSAILGLMGIVYPVSIFSIQLSNLIISSFLSFTLTSSLLLVIILLFVLFFGNFYCSLLCPLGCIQEIFSLFSFKKNKYINFNKFRYLFLFIYIALLLSGTTFLLKYLEPYTIFSSFFNFSYVSILFFILIIFSALIKNRFFCRVMCPVGSILGIVSKYSRKKFKIIEANCVKCGKCESICQYACIDSNSYFINNEICSNCLKCISVCQHNAIKYTSKLSNIVPFNINRRDFIIGSVSLVASLSLFRTVSNNAKKIYSDISQYILPPNSLSSDKFNSVCNNCGLCVSNCPSKIIQNSNNEIPIVHLNYDKNYCKEDCNICSKVCPTNAIKYFKISDKNKIKIAQARIVSDVCTHCDLCIKACNYGAIKKDYLELPVIDYSKCIGCGACKIVCDSNTIDLFALKS